MEKRVELLCEKCKTKFTTKDKRNYKISNSDSNVLQEYYNITITGNAYICTHCKQELEKIKKKFLRNKSGHPILCENCKNLIKENDLDANIISSGTRTFLIRKNPEKEIKKGRNAMICGDCYNKIQIEIEKDEKRDENPYFHDMD